jgi:hypothetical protein
MPDWFACREPQPSFATASSKLISRLSRTGDTLGPVTSDEAANLLAVDGPANALKNDAGPGEWMPLNGSYRCTYVLCGTSRSPANTLPITVADRDAAPAITRSCP